MGKKTVRVSVGTDMFKKIYELLTPPFDSHLS